MIISNQTKKVRLPLTSSLELELVIFKTTDIGKKESYHKNESILVKLLKTLIRINILLLKYLN